MLNFTECAVLNQHAAINYQMVLDDAQTTFNRINARRRQSVRRLANAARRHCRLVALDAALVGSIVTSIVTLLAIMVG